LELRGDGEMAKRKPTTWEFLKTCRKCGKIHTPHPYMKPGRKVPEDGHGITWNDPVDHHTYAPRVNPEIVDALEREYAATAVARPRTLQTTGG